MCTVLGTVSTDKPPHNSVSDNAFFPLLHDLKSIISKSLFVISKLVRDFFFKFIFKLFNHFILTHKVS